jgi:hypothetical protein
MVTVDWQMMRDLVYIRGSRISEMIEKNWGAGQHCDRSLSISESLLLEYLRMQRREKSKPRSMRTSRSR